MRSMAAMKENRSRRQRQRPRPRKQMELFGSVRPGPGGVPLWPELPEEARSTLMALMAQLILDHVAKAVRPPAKEASHDL
jgi:hypothetical protein